MQITRLDFELCLFMLSIQIRPYGHWHVYSAVYAPCYIQAQYGILYACIQLNHSIDQIEICTMYIILRSWCLLPHQFNNGTSISYPPILQGHSV